MRVLNEIVARLANKDVTGYFWGVSRFKSQALLDEKAVLSAMGYVALNPIRAAMASTPETSDQTSIRMRIEHWKSKANNIEQDSTDTSTEVVTTLRRQSFAMTCQEASPSILSITSNHIGPRHLHGPLLTSVRNRIRMQ